MDNIALRVVLWTPTLVSDGSLLEQLGVVLQPVGLSGVVGAMILVGV